LKKRKELVPGLEEKLELLSACYKEVTAAPSTFIIGYVQLIWFSFHSWQEACLKQQRVHPTQEQTNSQGKIE